MYLRGTVSREWKGNLFLMLQEMEMEILIAFLSGKVLKTPRASSSFREWPTQDQWLPGREEKQTS